MKTVAQPIGSGWEHLTAVPATSEPPAPEETPVPRSRIRRRFQAMLVQILGDEADKPTSHEPVATPEPRGHHSKHRRTAR